MSESKQTTELKEVEVKVQSLNGKAEEKPLSPWEKGQMPVFGPKWEERNRQLEEEYKERQKQMPERRKQALFRATCPYVSKMIVVIMLGFLTIVQLNVICSRLPEAICNGFQYVAIAVIALVVVGQISQAWVTYKYQSLLERTKQGELEPHHLPRDKKTGFLLHTYSDGYDWFINCLFTCGCVSDLDECQAVWRGSVSTDALPNNKPLRLGN